MTLNQSKAVFDETGFVVARGLFTADEAAALPVTI